MKGLIKGQLVIWAYKENILGIILSAFLFGGVGRCVVIHDAPSFFSLTIKIGSFSLSCDILRISLVYVFATSK